MKFTTYQNNLCTQTTVMLYEGILHRINTREIFSYVGLLCYRSRNSPIDHTGISKLNLEGYVDYQFILELVGMFGKMQAMFR